jgi:hypothetical protein
MIYTIVDKYGEVKSLISCLEIDLEANTPPGCEAIEGHFEGKYFDGETWIDCPARPDGLGLVYVRKTHQWETDPDALAQAQATQARQARQQALGAPFTYLGEVFQADQDSLNKMVSSYGVISITGDTIDWKLLNNSTIKLDAKSLFTLIKLIYQRNQQIIQT